MSSSVQLDGNGYVPPLSGTETTSSSAVKWGFGFRQSVRVSIRSEESEGSGESGALPTRSRLRRVSRRRREAARRSAAFSSDEEEWPVSRISSSTRKPREPRVVLPSQIVPEPEVGSASDAGVLPQHRDVHKNRRRAAVLLLETLDVDGRRTGPCVDYHKFFPRSSLYTRTLIVPKVERELKPCRAPANCLSYELQKRRCVKPGDSRRPQSLSVGSRKGRRQGSKRHRNSAPLEGVVTRNPISESSIYDLGSSESDERLTESDNSGTRSFSTHPLVISRQVDISEESAAESDEDLFTALFAQAKTDPDAVLRGSLNTTLRKGKHSRPRQPSIMVNSKKDAQSLADQNGANDDKRPRDVACRKEDGAGVEGSCPNPSPVQEDLSQFDKSLVASLQFSGVTKRIEVDAEGRQSVVPTWSILPVVRTKTKGFGDFELHTKRFGSKYLKKYGFTGRLGAAGQGISNPLEGRPAAGRSGLGARFDDSVELATVGHEDGMQDLEDCVEKFTSKEEAGVAKVSNKSINGKRKRSFRPEDVESDLYSTRRSSALGPSLLQEDAPTWSSKMARLHEDVASMSNDDDEFETYDEMEENDFDTGRRGILVDFDAVVKDAFRRRVEAFKAGTSGFDGIPASFDVENALYADARDLGDENAVRNILVVNNIEATDEQCDALLSRVDNAFDALEAPVKDDALVSALRAASQKCHIGVLHRGSKRRLNSELKSMNLSSAFNTRKVVLHYSDTSPYTRSWKELLCRLGVTARQSMFVVHDGNMDPAPSFAKAGHILGARVMIRADVPEEIMQDKERLESYFDADFVTAGNSSHEGTLSFKKLLRGRAPPQQRRRVLSLYGTEGLWYAGRVEYQCRLENRPDDKVLVRYYKWDNLEWVDPNDTVPLPRRDYETMESHGFCGLLDPDVSML